MTCHQNRTRRRTGAAAALLVPAAGAALLVFISGCVGPGDDDAPQDLDLPYDYSMFEDAYEQPWCGLLPEMVPANGFLDQDLEVELGGGTSSCHVSQHGQDGYRTVGVVVYGQWDEYMDTAQAYFADRIENTDAIPVEGIGEETAFIPPGTESAIGDVYPNEVTLLVLEGNLVFAFEALTQMDLKTPNLRMADLPLAAETAIGTAEAYLAEFGAANHTIQAPTDAPDAGTTELSDLCAVLEPGGMGLADDQADWADQSPVMDRCHWNDGSTDLWLSAEAVGPLEAAGISGEAFASWWTQSALPEGRTELGVGDESYTRAIDPEEDLDYEPREPATDFVIRIGNVVLQGRYSDGTEDSLAVADGLASAIADQVQSSLAGG